MQEKYLQWHPAFYAGLQIELCDERDNLIFEEEHLLGSKPTQIDVLVVKKEKDIPVKKNIGRIFKKHNIIEYKSPTDYLSIDDFYKVYAYACFYKSQAEEVDVIKITEITLSLVSNGFPKKLVNHLSKVRGYQVKQIERGIYYILGDIFEIQLLVLSRLSKEENLWLHSLTNELSSEKEAEELVLEYQKHKEDKRYEAGMDVIVRANVERFQEVRDMCKALEELMQDKLDEKLLQGISQGIAEGSEDKTRTIVKNMLLRGMSDNDIMALAECNQALVDQVRKSLSVK